MCLDLVVKHHVCLAAFFSTQPTSRNSVSKLPQVGAARDSSLHSCPALKVGCSHHDGAEAVPSRRQGQEAWQLQGDAAQLSAQTVASCHLQGTCTGEAPGEVARHQSQQEAWFQGCSAAGCSVRGQLPPVPVHARDLT